MHIWCYNIKNYCMKHIKKWGGHSFQIDGQAFTSSYLNCRSWYRIDKKVKHIDVSCSVNTCMTLMA